MEIDKLEKEINQVINRHKNVVIQAEISFKLGCDPAIIKHHVYSNHVIKILNSVLKRIDGNKSALEYL